MQLRAPDAASSRHLPRRWACPCRYTLTVNYARASPGAQQTTPDNATGGREASAGPRAAGAAAPSPAASALLPELAQLRWLEVLNLEVVIPPSRPGPRPGGLPREWWLPGAFPRLKQ